MEFDLEYARRVILAEAEAIASMTPIVNGAFAKAAEMIYHCSGSCIVSGIGKAGLVGQKIAATLASTGTRSHFLHPSEAIHGDLGRVHHDDAVLMLSFSGETEEISRLLPSLQPAYSLSDIDLEKWEASLLPRADGTRTIAELVAYANKPEEIVHGFLYGLVALSILERRA